MKSEITEEDGVVHFAVDAICSIDGRVLARASSRAEMLKPIEELVALHS